MKLANQRSQRLPRVRPVWFSVNGEGPLDYGLRHKSGRLGEAAPPGRFLRSRREGLSPSMCVHEKRKGLRPGIKPSMQLLLAEANLPKLPGNGKVNLKALAAFRS